MQIRPIQKTQQNYRNNNFKGAVDKSVIRYLDNTCLHSNNTKEARVFADKILEKLTQFMKTLHKDTIISVKEEMVTRRVSLPFDDEPAYIDTGLRKYFTEFSNKTTKSKFSLSHPCEFIVGGWAKPIKRSEKILLDSHDDMALKQFDTHVNTLIKFFSDDNKDADRLLFNNMLKYNRDRLTFLPDFIEKFRQNKVEEKAKKIANEFGMKPTEKQKDGFLRYEADDPASRIRRGFTVRSALFYEL